MKEYKVVSWTVGLTNNNQRLEDTLNEYGRQGWKAIDLDHDRSRIVFERDKNR